ncbi:MAG: HD-GYP domain-containing protein [Planctomycetota bacterium]|jgi:HD-GYP domain-containing protein (c-di-GMP phosphodiesterase class II)
MKQLALLVGLQAAGLAFGLLLHSTAVGTVQFPQAGTGPGPVSAGVLPAGTAAITTFAWIATVQAIICYLVFDRLYHRIRQHTAGIKSVVRRQNRDLLRTQEAVVIGMTNLAECRDGDDEGHHKRVGQLAELLARAAAKRPEFAAQITPDFIRYLSVSAMLHDIGKVGIDDAILTKPGRLTVEERRAMEQHTRISSDCLARMEACLGDANFLEMAHRIALHHHERWDGTGYPTTLHGEGIPLEARITAIADVYDALASTRPYKRAYPHQACVRLICEAAGTQFDPRLVEVFLSVADQFATIAADGSSSERSAASDLQPQPSRSTVEVIADETTVPSGDTADMSGDILDLFMGHNDHDAEQSDLVPAAAPSRDAVLPE